MLVQNCHLLKRFFSKLQVVPNQFTCESHEWFKSHLRKHQSGKSKEKQETLTESPNNPDRKCCPHCDFTYVRSTALEEHVRELIRHKCSFYIQGDPCFRGMYNVGIGTKVIFKYEYVVFVFLGGSYARNLNVVSSKPKA